MPVRSCKAHLQVLKSSLLPCPHQKPTPEVAARGCPAAMASGVLRSQGRAGGWARAASALPCSPVPSLTALPGRQPGRSGCQLPAC